MAIWCYTVEFNVQQPNEHQKSRYFRFILHVKTSFLLTIISNGKEQK
nr:MAG TPA: hypothetical protein [Caudoviricetes sp.]